MSRPVEDFVTDRLEASEFWRAAAVAVTKPERLEALILFAATDRVRLALASIRDHLGER